MSDAYASRNAAKSPLFKAGTMAANGPFFGSGTQSSVMPD
jgi:hypothetical protein